MRSVSKFIWPATFLAPSSFIIGFFFFTLLVIFRFSTAPYIGPNEFGEGFTLNNFERFLGSWFYFKYLVRSLWISFYSTVITAVFGYTVAYYMYRSTAWVRVIVSTIIIVQFFTAYVIRTYSVMLVIGKTGFLNRTLMALGIIDEPLALLFTETGVAIGMVLVSLPFMIFPIYSSLQSVPGNIELAAKSLGASDVRVFWEVIFPMTIPGVAAGVVIVYLFELTSYIVPGILGGGYVDMIANFVYSKAMLSFDYPLASAAAVIMLLVSGVMIYLLQKLFTILTPPSIR